MTTANDDLERRFPRRLLLAFTGTAAAAGVAQVVSASPASAGAATSTWKLGGNADVSTDGSNFLGPTVVAPLIFKTRTSTTAAVTERMRITPQGRVGIGKTAPVAQLDVTTAQPVGIAGRTTSTSTTTERSGVTGTSTTAGNGVKGISTDGYGVSGVSTNNVGVRGDGSIYGGEFSSSSTGVSATGGTYGLYGSGFYGGVGIGSSIGFYGSGPTALYGSGGTNGVYGGGTTNGVYGSGPTGVLGSGSTNGVMGSRSGNSGNGVLGSGGQYGVLGQSGSTAGVRGDSGYVGVWGQAPSFGVYALATATSGQTYGLYAQASNSASFAVYANGNVAVNGTLSKSAGSFRIDHPLAPDTRWLSHSFVESPDMMNVYNGNAVLDDAGEATVTLPDYFATLNRDYRYQLTPIGAHAPVYVASKVKDNRFRIAGGTAGLEVSWQVTGIRQDAYAKAHPIEVDTPKSAEERGTRQFVAPGSSHRRMHVGPTHPEPQDPVKVPAPPAAPAHLTRPRA